MIGLPKYELPTATLDKYTLPRYSVTSPATGGAGPPPDTDPNIISYWKFDEGSGTTAADSVGVNTGTLSGPTWVNPGVFGYAGDNQLDFDGTDAVTLAGDPSFSDIVGVNSDFTIYGWFNSDTTATRQFICGDYNAAVTTLSFSLELTTGNDFTYDVFGATGQRIKVTYAMNWIAGTTYFYALTFNATTKTITLYIDGAAVSSAANAILGNLNNNSGSALRLGAVGVGGSLKFKGALDNFIIYSDIRTAGEILADYNNWQAA